jgi:hypothetical protein
VIRFDLQFDGYHNLDPPQLLLFILLLLLVVVDAMKKKTTPIPKYKATLNFPDQQPQL